ncbi:putative DNA-directed RNA polymerase III subunit rpc6 [Yarrowia sp. C11]|nr:putative DNA-directed RNA polymerase III subunit rpc6 [Yarrowia sp. C11]KAG5364603.1 putative DNA-directed RNA polymerase III subunit rpc6 [Yarrowia sp. E02]
MTAEDLHAKMLEGPKAKLYSYAEVATLVDVAGATLEGWIEELHNSSRVKVLEQGGQVMLQAVSIETADVVSKLSSDEYIVYNYIAESGRNGIWVRTITAKSNLHINVVHRCLKSLEQQHIIKMVKSVQQKTRKMYMLYNLQPSAELTGGPWFSDAELDVEFVDLLLNVVYHYCEENTNLALGANAPPVQVTDIKQFIVDQEVSRVELDEGHIRTLCEVLVYDDRLERCKAGYKATLNGDLPDEELPKDAYTESVCGQCPVFNVCSAGGPVDVECNYFDEWLDGVDAR